MKLGPPKLPLNAALAISAQLAATTTFLNSPTATRRRRSWRVILRPETKPPIEQRD
jgi:hypothetical protein